MAIERRMLFSALVLMAVLVPLVISARRYGFGSQNSPEKFEYGDPLYIVANRVLDRNNSCEQYSYFDFPFCPPGEQITYEKSSFEEVLAGDCHTITKYVLRFMEQTDEKILCEKILTKEEVAKFRDAIKRESFYEIAYNNFAFRVDIGLKGTEWSPLPVPRYFLITHIDFHVDYLENQVTNMSIRGIPQFYVDITEAADIKVNFSYSVFWYESDRAHVVNVLNENQLYKEDRISIEDDSRWMSLSVFWTNVTLVWVGLLLAVTLPYLVKYWMRTRCSNREEGHSQRPQHIHGDTCMCPQYTSLLGAILGNGIQLFISICIFFFLACGGFLHPCNLQSLCSQILWTFCFTSVIAGYKATEFHTRFMPVDWKECTFQAGTVYLIPVLTTVLVAYGLVITRSGMSGVPELGIICENLVVWGFVTVILVSLGSTLAHCSSPQSEPPCTAQRLPRDKTRTSWYMKTPAQMLFGAFLPSLAIFPDMDGIYASLWKFKICGAFHLMLASFIVLVLLTAAVAIFCTSYELVKDNHQWWWRSVFRGGAPAIFIFVYGIYFFSRVPDIGDAMLLRVLAYNACISYALFLILGTVGFYSSSFLFHSIFPQQKRE